MNFSRFLKENLKPSIDDNDVLNKLSELNIYYDRTKQESGTLLYKFDNRYSLEYDGSMFILYRHGNIIHRENARNKKEIYSALDKWNDSYQMSISELPDEDDIDVDELINKITSNSEEGEEDDKL